MKAIDYRPMTSDTLERKCGQMNMLSEMLHTALEAREWDPEHRRFAEMELATLVHERARIAAELAQRGEEAQQELLPW